MARMWGESREKARERAGATGWLRVKSEKPAKSFSEKDFPHLNNKSMRGVLATALSILQKGI